MRPPLPQQQHRPPRPSPLARVHNTRPLSQDPSLGLVRDPKFWKRFSTAVHLTEAQAKDLEVGGSVKSSSTFDVKEGDDWLSQQRKERRRCRICCLFITLAVVLVIIAAVMVFLYFTKFRK